ncbi:MAG: NifU family protein [Bacteroidia bacterium]|nr:NifU family protein [Bacteroidia bacterium]MBP9688731.1 NifU family protein [Bacteroidia bacterium]
MTNNKDIIEIYTEPTPNPETMKFVFNREIYAEQSADFPTIESTSYSPLAKNLFEFSFVNGVFIMNDFVTITRMPGVEWEEIIPIMKEFLKSYIAAGEPIVFERPEENTKDYGADNDIVAQIKEILETYIKPAVEVDGGQISFRDFENGIVTVELRGSCSGCPSSSVTLKRGIEGMLTKMVPSVKEVVAHSL